MNKRLFQKALVGLIGPSAVKYLDAGVYVENSDPQAGMLMLSVIVSTSSIIKSWENGMVS